MDNTNKVDLEYCQQSSEDNHITEINAYYFARDNVSPSCSTSVSILLTPSYRINDSLTVLYSAIHD